MRTCHEERYSCGSGWAETRSDDVIVISSGLPEFGFEVYIVLANLDYKVKPEICTLPDSKSLIKDTIKLHYGKCRI